MSYATAVILTAPIRHRRVRGCEDNDLILWLPSTHAIVTGDSLSDFGDGLDVQLALERVLS